MLGDGRRIKKLKTLAEMFALDRNALLCDLAETYGIFNLRALRADMLAALACGLREDSRIKLRMADMNYLPPFASLALVSDTLAGIRYGLLAKKGEPQPARLLDDVLGKSDRAVRDAKQKDKAYLKVRDSIIASVQEREGLV